MRVTKDRATTCDLVRGPPPDDTSQLARSAMSGDGAFSSDPRIELSGLPWIAMADFYDFAPVSGYCCCPPCACVCLANDVQRGRHYAAVLPARIEMNQPIAPCLCLTTERCMVDSPSLLFYDQPPNRIGTCCYCCPAVWCGHPIVRSQRRSLQRGRCTHSPRHTTVRGAGVGCPRLRALTPRAHPQRARAHSAHSSVCPVPCIGSSGMHPHSLRAPPAFAALRADLCEEDDVLLLHRLQQLLRRECQRVPLHLLGLPQDEALHLRRSALL